MMLLVLAVLFLVLLLSTTLKSIELSNKLKHNIIAHTVWRTGLTCGVCHYCYAVFLFILFVGIRVAICKIRGIVGTRTEDLDIIILASLLNSRPTLNEREGEEDCAARKPESVSPPEPTSLPNLYII